MRLIIEITVIIKKKSFPGFIDELYKRDCSILDLQHIEETDEGAMYTLRVSSNNLKRFEEFITIIGSAGEKYKIVSTKNIIEERVVGGLISVAGRMPVENISDLNTSVLGAADLIHEKIKQEDGARYTGIARSVCLLAGIKADEEGERVRLLHEYASAERDAVILNRFSGLNGYPLAVRYDHPEDIITVMKKIERNYAAIRVMRIDDASLMLYELIFSDLTVPVVSMEHDDIPLIMLSYIIRIMIKYRLKAEEATVGFIGIDLSAIRLTRVLDKIGFRRVLGFDHGEKAMLALENQGGLATTDQNIFGNADITVLLKNNFDHDEYRKIRPGQFVICFMEDEVPDIEAVSDKGVREFIKRDVTHLAAVVPGILKGVIDADIRNISDVRLVEYAKKLAGFLSETFEFPHIFGNIHEKVAGVIASGAEK